MSIFSRLSLSTWTNFQQKSLTLLLRNSLHKKYQKTTPDKYNMEETAKSLKQVYEKSANVVKAK